MKIDLLDAREQIRIKPKHELHTVFTMIYGNMISRGMQQGDKNCPTTFQRLMNTLFADMIAVFVHCYQDDIFVYSDTLEEHMAHLKLVFQRLHKLRLYLSDNLNKLDILSSYMECLGFFIDNEGRYSYGPCQNGKDTRLEDSLQLPRCAQVQRSCAILGAIPA